MKRRADYVTYKLWGETDFTAKLIRTLLAENGNAWFGRQYLREKTKDVGFQGDVVHWTGHRTNSSCATGPILETRTSTELGKEYRLHEDFVSIYSEATDGGLIGW